MLVTIGYCVVAVIIIVIMKMGRSGFANYAHHPRKKKVPNLSNNYF